jgi:hypothetical protein
MSHSLVTDKLPWYREPWPWILMSGPAIVVVAGFATAYLAVISNDGLVDDDYYKQGLAVNQRTTLDQQGVQLGIRAEVIRGGAGNQVRVFLQGNQNDALPSALKLRLSHPTRSGIDQKVDLIAEGVGIYSGKLDAPLSGRWHVVLQDTQNEWRLSGDWNIEKQSTLRLGTAVRTESVSDVNSDKKGG